ncbi:MAG: hypothetical protein KDA71_11915 [Planctomycetales bacterium]|nr:hypothetical protein [Planctomycetales bacterium]
MQRPAVAALLFAFVASPLASFALPSLSAADPPRVSFDVTELVECHEVTPPEFAAVHPDERLVDAVIRVSSIFGGGNPDDLVEFQYQLESVEQTALIVDYDPKTELASDIAGNITIERKEEGTKGIGLSLSGSHEALAKINGSADFTKKTLESVRYEQLPKLQPVSSSGTLQRGYGVYFKLKATDRTWLEGEKLFRLTLRVPVSWRADYLRITGQAIGVKRGLVRQLDERVVCGRVDSLVTMHLVGDVEARRAADWMIDRRRQLVSAASQQHSDIDRRRYPTVFHKVGAAFDVVDPAIASDWLPRLLNTPAGQFHSALPNRLPVDVRVAALDYLEAKNDLHQLALARHVVAKPVAPAESAEDKFTSAASVSANAETASVAVSQ